MSKPWVTLDARETPDGVLELRRRDAKDFLILVGGRVLMNSRENQSEVVLGRAACAALCEPTGGNRVLVGGLGMGITLRAVLEAVHADCRVEVAELHPVVAEWCRGPLAELTEGAVLDPRVEVVLDDVSEVIRRGRETPYDAIVLDLFEGPHAKTDARKDPLYGRGAIDRTWDALTPNGTLGVWAEGKDEGFEQRLRRRGFAVETRRPGRGGYRHWVMLARRPGRRPDRRANEAG